MTATDSRPGDAAAPSLVRTLIRRIVDGVAVGQKYHLKVVFSDQTAHETTRLGDPDVTIIFRNRRAEWRMVLGGMFEFLESYFDGDVDIVGDQGLRKLVNIGYRKTFGRFEHPLTLVKRHLLEWRQNNKDFAQAKRNAAFHYGLPTEFFRLVLGGTFGYSEGFWKDDTRSLDEAQHNNFDMICQKLRLRPGDKLVEVGPGWGYLSMLAAEKYGAEVTGYGLVASQNDAMRRLMKARNCNEQWIESVARALRPGGMGLISATFNMKQRPTNYCTIKHIFPGGYIPSLAQTLIFMEKHGLNVQAIDNLEANWEHIRAIDPQRFSEKFRRTWLFYLGGAAETFEAAREIINCYHITFVKGHFSAAAPG